MHARPRAERHAPEVHRRFGLHHALPSKAVLFATIPGRGDRWRTNSLCRPDCYSFSTAAEGPLPTVAILVFVRGHRKVQ